MMRRFSFSSLVLRLRQLSAVALALVLFSTLTKEVYAQTSTSGQGTQQLGGSYVDNDYPAAIMDAIQNNGVNGPGWGAMNLTTLEREPVRRILGAVPGYTVPYTAYQTNPQYVREMNEASALAMVGRYMGMMYTNPPADLALWIQDSGQALGFLPRPAYAQARGIGFSGLAPLLDIWRGFRNIAYALIAIIMVVVGFMVMFRKKIDPKTVVTVQNSLPRIVVTLLLITFSYAIAGFLIDLMYVLIAMGIAILRTSGLRGAGGINVFGQEADLVRGGFFTLLGSIFAPIVKLNPMSNVGENIASGNIVELLKNLGSGLILFNPLIPLAPGGLIILILSIAYLFAFIRIFFMLLSAYVNIILSVLIGPLQILIDAIPGGNGFASWIKNLIMNILPFPITVFMLILGSALMSNVAGGQLWQPPFLPKIDQVQVGPIGIGQSNFTGNFAMSLLFLGIVLTIPSVVASLKELLKAQALPTGVSAVSGMAGTSFGILMQGYQLLSQHRLMEAYRKSLPGAQRGGGRGGGGGEG